MTKILALLGVILILVTGAAAVGLLDGASSSAPATTAGTQSSSAASIPIKAFAFKPAKLMVSVGAKVTFTNLDTAEHTATADQGAFDTGTLTKGQSKTLTLSTAGTFTYHCAFHPFMVASVTVG